ncbi:MAG TPA: carbamoyltransferase HypF [Pirellulales bacterium]|jgi:hydrogenase maturation protein HypF|nr:carbamoyltransferase HypF [Pirellulales bacterium]
MERVAIRVRGIVQGVGFRPFVFGLASRLALRGFVRNETSAVLIEVEGARGALDEFLVELKHKPPPLARIHEIDCRPVEPRGTGTFQIETSAADAQRSVFISPDVATCDDCLAELFDPANRRYRYPFINCTNCGPRLTIVTGAPYDRQRTTMAGFELCPECRAEYENPRDRRFHAEPIACHVCGPSLRLLDANGRNSGSDDPLVDFASVLREGGIGALKGLGGYHLACDATNESAVARLRGRKHREEKPLAVMFADLAAVARYCELDEAERRTILSARRPIVLVRWRRTGDAARRLASSVAPNNPRLGVMLPYTPLHHLLLRQLDGLPLVMTSGNRSDEPIAYLDVGVSEQLAGIADGYLTHDRAIHVRCDDSVVRIDAGRETPIRRSRGYAPEPLPLPIECPVSLLAVGGQLKNTFALGRDRHAFLSHHLGDLEHYEAYRAFERDIQLYEQLFKITPAAIIHDLHPDYASTRYAIERSARDGLPIFAVQHHHAHLASCLAEHGLDEPAIGVSLDGTGYGTDGAIWGGEFLVGDFGAFRRAAHLRYVGMPGGDRAIREPWRMAAAHLLDAGLDLSPLAPRVEPNKLRIVQQMLDKRYNTPQTSSMGRLFDAVATLVGLRDTVSYEAQAAVELEALATGCQTDGEYPLAIEAPSSEDPWSRPMAIDTRPLISAIAAEVARGIDSATVARKFQRSVATMVVEVCRQLRRDTALNLIALSGGVFLNALLSREVEQRLERDDFRVCVHRRVPAGDGGLSLGQVAIGARLLARRPSPGYLGET